MNNRIEALLSPSETALWFIVGNRAIGTVLNPPKLLGQNGRWTIWRGSIANLKKDCRPLTPQEVYEKLSACGTIKDGEIIIDLR